VSAAPTPDQFQPWGNVHEINDTWPTTERPALQIHDELVRALIDAASKGGNFLLNVGPTPEGRSSPSSRSACADRRVARANGEAIYGTTYGRCRSAVRPFHGQGRNGVLARVRYACGDARGERIARPLGHVVGLAQAALVHAAGRPAGDPRGGLTADPYATVIAVKTSSGKFGGCCSRQSSAASAALISAAAWGSPECCAASIPRV